MTRNGVRVGRKRRVGVGVMVAVRVMAEVVVGVTVESTVAIATCVEGIGVANEERAHASSESKAR